MIEKIRECYNALELPFNEEVIDRADRVGTQYTDKISKKEGQINNWEVQIMENIAEALQFSTKSSKRWQEENTSKFQYFC